MTGREKIILGVMTVAVIGGGLHFGLPSAGPARTATTAKPELAALMTQIQVDVQSLRLSEREQHILKLAMAPWENDPFLTSPLSPMDATAGEVAEEDYDLPVYSGYLDIGDRTLAIIDGRDYREDQLLRGGGYRVTGIHPDRVELLRVDNARAISIPLFEETPDHEHDL